MCISNDVKRDPAIKDKMIVSRNTNPEFELLAASDSRFKFLACTLRSS